MSRTETIAHITATLTTLPDDRVQALAELADEWAGPIVVEDDHTRAAIAEGIAQANRGEFATDAEVEAAFARFRG